MIETMSRKSTVEPILSGRDAWIQMAGSFAFAAALALMVEPSYLGALFFFLCGIPGLVALVWPERSKVGIIFDELGFEHFAALRGTRTVAYADITCIEALATGGGDMGDAVDLIVHTAACKVRVREQDLFGDGFFDLLAALPEFRREQYAAAAQHQLRGWENMVGKKLVVMTRASG